MRYHHHVPHFATLPTTSWEALSWLPPSRIPPAWTTACSDQAGSLYVAGMPANRNANLTASPANLKTSPVQPANNVWLLAEAVYVAGMPAGRSKLQISRIPSLSFMPRLWHILHRYSKYMGSAYSTRYTKRARRACGGGG